MRLKVIKRTKLIIKLPIRILSKARDCYMKTMFDCAGRRYQGNPMGYAYTPAPQGPNSAGFKGLTDEDIRQLVRMSIKMGPSETERAEEWLKMGTLQGGVGKERSYSVGVGKIGRIDEEKPCEFVEVDDYNIKDHTNSRNRSYVVRNKNVSMLLAR